MKISATVMILAILMLAVQACDSVSWGQPDTAPAGNASPAATQSPGAYPAPGGKAYPGPGGSRVTIPARTPVPPVDAPATRAGTASISGILYSTKLSFVLPKTTFYLKRATAIVVTPSLPIFNGPVAAEGDIESMTDAKGELRISDIPPGEYYLVVWSAYNWIPAATSLADNTPWKFVLEANDRKPMGVVYVSWP